MTKPRVSPAEDVAKSDDPDAAASAFVEAFARDADADVRIDGVNLAYACRRSLIQAASAALKARAFPDRVAEDAAFRKRWGLPADTAGRTPSWISTTLAASAATGLAAARRLLGAGLSPPAPGAHRIVCKDSRRLSTLVARLRLDPAAEILFVGTALTARGLTPYVSVPPGPPTRRKRLERFEAAAVDALERLDACSQQALDLVMREAAAEHARIAAIRRAIAHTRPHVILLQDDTSPDGLTWALAAAAAGVPTLTLAHGLDCERSFLDAAFADVKCVWGPARAGMIDRAGTGCSIRRRIAATGNPAFDDRRPPERLGPPGATWLWATRPHTPRKLFSAGRFAQEGADILSALLSALRRSPQARLLVKPHPTDYESIYARMIAEAGLGARATVVKGPIGPALETADVVVAEDTTAALDACLSGKPMAHAHFAPTPPALPLVAYGAALPGDTPATLTASVLALSEPDDAGRSEMFAGQRRFIDAYAGPLDGKSGERVAAEVSGLINS